MTPTTESQNISSRMPNFEEEENAQGVGETGSDGSAGDGDATSSQGEPENSEASEVPLRNSQVSKAKEDHSI